MLTSVDWSTDRDYKTNGENEPIQFYLDALANSNEFHLLLGYFSSAAINLLSVGFASFISKGGTMRMVINHLLSEKDKETISKVEDNPNEIRVFDLTDMVSLGSVLDEYGKQFFECLAYLIAEKRIEIKIIKPKNGKGIAHYKSGVFSDGENAVGYQASCNFTYYGLSENIEQLEAFLSWENGRSNKLIKKQLKLIDNYFAEKEEDVEYVPVNEIEVVLKDKFGKKDINELLVQEEQLLKKKQSLITNPKIKKTLNRLFNEIENIRRSPRFPYHDGPRAYQKEAYEKWVANDYKGLFAMATGTGKTLTACYCLIEEFKKSKTQKNIIVVPGIELINQWYDELKLNNFNTIIKWASNNSKLESADINYIRVLMHDNDLSALNIVITYDSFVTDRFLKIFEDKMKDFIVIFDEAHNMGADSFKKRLKDIQINKTIGLSATPLRLWDENNENQFIEDFFNTKPPYTFSYGMKEAIEKGFLCKYRYEPFFVNFTDIEWDEYLILTQQLHHKKEGETINTKAALKRQLLKDQAENKNQAVLEIVKILDEKNKSANTLIYCPKGTDNEKDDRYIFLLQDKIKNYFPQINTATFLGITQGREKLLEDFENEDVHMLLAIKCLDEGVNIPKIMNAIFVASGQNYREFVQRRGRVLRNYKRNGFKKEYADIYDIVVLPTLEQFNNNRSSAERLIVSEFKRLYEFYDLSSEKLNAYYKMSNELKKYNLTEGHINTLVKNEK